MKLISRRLPVWLAGAAVAAGSMVAVSGTPALACGDEDLPAAAGAPAVLAAASATPAPSPKTLPAAMLVVRTTFPAELRRGGPYREFDIKVTNPSASTGYRELRVWLDLWGFAPNPGPGRGYLAAQDVRLDQRCRGAWLPVPLHDGDCDPGIGALVGVPSDLAPGATWSVHLRIRLTDSTPVRLRSAEYFIHAGSAGDTRDITGRFAIQPRRASGGHVGTPKPIGTGSPTDSPIASPTASRTLTPTASPTLTPTDAPGKPGQPAAPGGQPSDLVQTGPAALALPLAGGVALLIIGGGLLISVWQRRRL